MKKLTAKETEGMTLEQFQAAMKDGRVEVKPEGSHKPTADQVTMNGRFGCEWVFLYRVWFVYDLHFRLCVYVRVHVSSLYAFTLELIMTWKGIMMANLWLAGHAIVFYGGAYLVWSLVK